MSRRTTGHDRTVDAPDGWEERAGSWARDDGGPLLREIWRSVNPENGVIEWRAQVFPRAAPDELLLDVFTGQDLHEGFHLCEEIEG